MSFVRKVTYNINDSNSGYVDTQTLQYQNIGNNVYTEYAYNPLYNLNGRVVGKATWIDVLNNLDDGNKYLTETGTYTFNNGDSFTYIYSGKSSGAIFNSTVVAQIVSGTGYYAGSTGYVTIFVNNTTGNRTVQIHAF